MSAPCSSHQQSAELPELIEELRRRSAEWTERAAAFTTGRELKTIVSYVFTDLLERIEEAAPQDDELAGRIRQYIAGNLHRSLTLKDLSEFLGYSEKYCSDLFRARMGCPFSKYLQRLRVERTKRLFLAPHTSVADVAEALGFCDQFSFSHFFKKVVGCSPHHFRQRGYRQD